jgi:hypothetical protein
MARKYDIIGIVNDIHPNLVDPRETDFVFSFLLVSLNEFLSPSLVQQTGWKVSSPFNFL